MPEALSLEATGGRECQGREERGRCHADLRVGRGHLALGSGDVRAALEKRRGHARGRRRHQARGCQRIGREAKVRRCLAREDRDRMLELRALHPDVDQLRLGAHKLGLGEHDVGELRHSDLVLILRQSERFLVGIDRFCQELGGGIEAAQHEIEIVAQRPVRPCQCQIEAGDQTRAGIGIVTGR